LGAQTIDHFIRRRALVRPDVKSILPIAFPKYFYPCGGKYEKGFPKGADMKPPRGYLNSLEAIIF
jgi:hypothetical protein